MDPRGIYLTAAASFAELVGRVPADAWRAPGLGGWDVRALTGHTARSLTTVLEYVRRPADTVACETAADYYVAAISLAIDPADVEARGVAAGQALGDDPATAVARLLSDVRKALDTVDDDAVITTIVGGMRVAPYLETRNLELTVHGLDLADALGLSYEVSREAVERTLVVLAGTASLTGRAAQTIRLLTGRGGSAFSLVAPPD